MKRRGDEEHFVFHQGCAWCPLDDLVFWRIKGATPQISKQKSWAIVRNADEEHLVFHQGCAWCPLDDLVFWRIKGATPQISERRS